MPRKPLDPQTPPGLSFAPGQLEQLVAQAMAARSAAPHEELGPPPAPERATPVTYRVRVELEEVEPPIWRVLDLNSDLTLDELHAALQLAMGWETPTCTPSTGGTPSRPSCLRTSSPRPTWQNVART